MTGAASGIGEQTALALADAGAELVLCDVNEEGLSRVEAEVARRSRCRLARRVDVSDREQMRALADEVHGLVPAVDVLVNNAGVGLSGGLLATSLEDWEWIVGVNLRGVVHGCHFFVPKMVERARGGHVVNVSSVLGYVGAPDVIGYATTKFAVFGLSESLRGELAPHGIGVSTICPGLVRTNIIATTRFRGEVDPEARRERVDKLYRDRDYGPDRVARAIVAAVERGRAVVPVTPEAWALYYLKRYAPAVVPAVGRLLQRRAE